MKRHKCFQAPAFDPFFPLKRSRGFLVEQEVGSWLARDRVALAENPPQEGHPGDRAGDEELPP